MGDTRQAAGAAATTASEIERAFAADPRFVVTRERLWYLADHPVATAVLEKRLAEDYRLAAVIGGSRVYSPLPER